MSEAPRLSAADELAEVRRVLAAHADEQGALLPILHEVQDTLGYVPSHAVQTIADAQNLSRAEVHGVITYYHHFRAEPPGRHVIQICRAEACQSMQGEKLARELLDHFGLEWGDTTPDGRLTVEATYCLGLCACAPSAMLDGQPMARLTPASIDEISHEVGR